MHSEAISDKVSLFVCGKVRTTVVATIAEIIDISDEVAVEMALEPKVYTFAGLQIAPGPLYYNGTNYEIKDSWNYFSNEGVYGKAEGSIYFNFIEMGQLFEKTDFGEQDGNIDNILNPFNGWRIPTDAEWQAIATTDPSVRTGSTVNGTPNAHWAGINLTDVSHAGNSTLLGFLLFPDGKNITGKAFEGFDKTYTMTDDGEIYYITDVTSSELAEYLSQGCVFLPASGYYFEDMYQETYNGFDVWCSTEANEETNAYGFSFFHTEDNSRAFWATEFEKLICSLPVRLVRE